MSQLQSCQDSIVSISSCTTNCQLNLPPSSTCLLLQNTTSESIACFPLDTSQDKKICFSLPPKTNPPQSIFAVIPTPTPLVFLLIGNTSNKHYLTVSSQTSVPNQPILIQTDQPSSIPFPDGWKQPTTQSNKPLWILPVVGALLLIASIILIVLGARPKQNESIQGKAIDPKLLWPGVALLILVILLTFGVLVLPGYPLSKYKSRSQCMQQATKNPQNEWKWSIPPNSGFYEFVCRAFDACICRSTVQENACLSFSSTNPAYAPNVWPMARKDAPHSSTCGCCDQSSNCVTFVNGAPSVCASAGPVSLPPQSPVTPVSPVSPVSPVTPVDPVSRPVVPDHVMITLPSNQVGMCAAADGTSCSNFFITYDTIKLTLTMQTQGAQSTTSIQQIYVEQDSKTQLASLYIDPPSKSQRKGLGLLSSNAQVGNVITVATGTDILQWYIASDKPSLVAAPRAFFTVNQQGAILYLSFGNLFNGSPVTLATQPSQFILTSTSSSPVSGMGCSCTKSRRTVSGKSSTGDNQATTALATRSKPHPWLSSKFVSYTSPKSILKASSSSINLPNLCCSTQYYICPVTSGNTCTSPCPSGSSCYLVSLTTGTNVGLWSNMGALGLDNQSWVFNNALSSGTTAIYLTDSLVGNNSPRAIGLLGSLSPTSQTLVGAVSASSAVEWNVTLSGSNYSFSTKDSNGTVYSLQFGSLMNGSQMFVSTATSNNLFAIIAPPSQISANANPPSVNLPSFALPTTLVNICGSTDGSTCSTVVVGIGSSGSPEMQTNNQSVTQIWLIKTIGSNQCQMLSFDNTQAIGYTGTLTCSGTPVSLVPASKAQNFYIQDGGGNGTIQFYVLDSKNCQYYLSFATTTNGSAIVFAPKTTNTLFIFQKPTLSPSNYVPTTTAYICGSTDGSTCSNSVVSIQDQTANIWMWQNVGSSGTSNQLWSMTPLPNPPNAFQILSFNNQSQIGFSESLNSSGTNLSLLPAYPPNIKWYVANGGNGTFVFYTVDSNNDMYFISFSNTSNQTPLIASSTTGSKFVLQTTKLPPPPPGTKPILPRMPVYICGSIDGSTCSDSVVSVQDSSTNIWMWQNVNNANNQQWTIYFNGNTNACTIQIYQTSWMQMGYTGTLSTSGTPVQLVPFVQPYITWYITSNSNGAYTIFTLDENNVIYYLNFANTGNGTPLILRPSVASFFFFQSAYVPPLNCCQNCIANCEEDGDTNPQDCISQCNTQCQSTTCGQ